MHIRLTFLGTGTSQGIPVIGCDCGACCSVDIRDKRLRASVLLEIETSANTLPTKFVIDAGPDFRQQMLGTGIKNLDGIILTHEHKDHTGGLDDVRSLNQISGKPMNIYAETRVQQSLKREYAYAFAEYKYPGAPEFNLCTIDETPFCINDTEVVPIRVHHHLLPILGFRICNIAYITDANRIEKHEKQKLLGLEMLTINVIRHTPHISHFSLPEVLELYRELKPKQMYLTHLSHQIEQHNELTAILPKGVQPAYDGLQLSF